jgi:hypothetical protein
LNISREFISEFFTTHPIVKELEGCSHGADRARTDDIQLAKLALSQLSYSPVYSMQRTMGLSGLEPPTSRLSGVRSKPAELQAQHDVRSRLGLSKPESSLFLK